MHAPTRAVGALVKAALILSASLAAQHAGAGIVFNWVTASVSPTTFAAEGRLELADALWWSGALQIPAVDVPDLGLYQGCNGAPYVYPDGSFGPGCTAITGIEDFYFNVNGREPYRGIFFASLKMRADFSLSDTNELAGAIRAESVDANAVMLRSTGNAGLWTVLFQSDDYGPGPNGCYHQPYCEGATGRWVLDTATIPVHEPATLALVGAALVGGCIAGSSARRRARPGASAAGRSAA
jgi:hypothetical protein